MDKPNLALSDVIVMTSNDVSSGEVICLRLKDVIAVLWVLDGFWLIASTRWVVRVWISS